MKKHLTNRFVTACFIQNDCESMSKNKFEALLTFICLLTLVTGFLSEWLGWIDHEVARIFYIVAYLSGGYAGTIESAKALMDRRINVDVLMILAAIGAAIIDEWVEGAILLFLFSLSNTLQNYAIGQSRREIKSLMKLRPNKALVKHSDGREEKLSVEELKTGDNVIVQPGERIPVDGIIQEGQGMINQSTITGESVPVDKTPGDEVFASTLNENGVLTIEVTKPAEETTLAKIIAMVEEAQSHKADTQRFLDEFEPKYAIGVIVSTILLILIPYALLNQPFDDVFYRAMTILVVASPCALIISTPASVLSAISNAARNGILFKGGAYLEQAASITTIAFDKTGTLTVGNPEVTDVVRVSNGKNRKYTVEQILRLAASAEEHSEHHLAEAILRKASEHNVTPASAKNVQSEAGKGITANVEGVTVKVGNHRFFDDNMNSWPDEINEQVEKLKSESKTVVYITADDIPVGLIALADTVRDEAEGAIRSLKKLGIKRLLMLTGDAEGVARSIAGKLGLDEYYAELLPDQKVEMIKKLSDEEPTAMVGDGVNDAPALASSHLGVAMGAAGTDVALEAADVVLMGDDLSKLPYTLELAKRSKKVVWQNIIFSLAVIVMLVASVFLFDLPLPLGVVGHEGSTLLVVLNGLRLLKGDQGTG